ncbi:hypothetical protein MIR68_000158 [Amoeboaphelidium protococcarum]|nr:hypothetical protein MIR68_000158 [Amoeboaphelidium protococcarum]
MDRPRSCQSITFDVPQILNYQHAIKIGVDAGLKNWISSYMPQLENQVLPLNQIVYDQSVRVVISKQDYMKKILSPTVAAAVQQHSEQSREFARSLKTVDLKVLQDRLPLYLGRFQEMREYYSSDQVLSLQLMPQTQQFGQKLSLTPPTSVDGQDSWTIHAERSQKHQSNIAQGGTTWGRAFYSSYGDSRKHQPFPTEAHDGNMSRALYCGIWGRRRPIHDD